MTDEERDNRRREILLAVADGRLSPQEAANRLHDLDHPEDAEPEPEPAYEPAPPRPVSTEGVARVRIEASLRKVEVIGDPSVQGASADGPHQAWQDGDTLVIEGEDIEEEFREIRHNARGYASTFSFSRGGLSAVTIGRQKALVVRMNPDLPLEVRVDAGALNTRGVHGPITARVSAGSARLDGFSAPIDVEVAAGGIKGTGRLDGGASRVRCDAGSVKLHLERGSSVEVNGEAHLGKVTLGGRESSGVLNDTSSVTIGGGDGTLDIECNLGSVKVTHG
jgi:hypothetical protein